MKKILLNISLALALGFTISSCNDWLDGVKQTSTVSDEIVWQDEAYVDKYVNAFYTYLNKYGQFGESQFYKRQNKMFHFHKTFCSKFSFINTKQNVHFIPFEYALNEIKASNTANS